MARAKTKREAACPIIGSAATSLLWLCCGGVVVWCGVVLDGAAVEPVRVCCMRSLLAVANL